MIVLEALAVQVPDVQVAVYVVVALGVTTSDAHVAPVSHAIVPPQFAAVNVTASLVQTLSLLAVIVGA